ncbi:acetyl-CoA hydrolase/transferase C-terminal domain-containing protein [Paucibacter sp. APW11]|uniref:Acetyl-CoA hydrolase/transferase C-terminal domain-containing protein n=1 Tax=Roseateles aquae TaxID=3077235 RepID=A0ABU3P4Y9_9BURK|nr:acetyl-CoA hydrolase/transferase C-terminal domain-containing protein [Paucibacter sp. APW11]MDT8997662.1 acetyl-CoA hydrolase/transferase C-terminal domain-containing protein [Paucibacter sp. APW11]
MQRFDRMDAAIDEVLARLGDEIVMAIPLGLGKPNPFVNALYRRIKAEGSRRLKIFTALSLEKPVGKSELEQHFLEPLVERVFADYPDLDYVKDSRAAALPPNIEVHEFFLKTGDYLDNSAAQQAYVSTNYSFVVRDMMALGVNLIAQAVAARPDPTAPEGPPLLSLSCNPDLTLDLIEKMAAAGRPLLRVAVLNEQLPFMGGTALCPARHVDLLIDAPGSSHALFAPPNAAVGWADYAIGLHAASLVPDGGTLQIGIGSLGDAIAQALIVREQNNPAFRHILSSLCPDGSAERELQRFDQGLYGCSEMFVNGFMRLIDAGLLRREVFDDLGLQQLANLGVLGEAPNLSALQALLASGRIASPLHAEDLRFLQHCGLLRTEVRLIGEELHAEGQVFSARLDERSAVQALQPLLGTRWRGGQVMHGGFFLGPRDFYQRLRDLSDEERARIAMTRIGFINELYGDGLASEQLKRAQRVKARFMNTTMQMTLLGAAASDALDPARVVSGVGGQYNFVAMGHALPDARSILMLRATHDNHQGLRSSIVWDCANTTIPRHLRDIVITEYGVADLRGQCDAEVIKRLLAIADSRFQDELLATAKAHGKLAADYQLPERYRANLPATLRERLRPWRNEGLLPDFPFGTDLTADELVIVRTLKKLKHASAHPLELVLMILKSLSGERPVPQAYLERLGLDQANSFKKQFMKRLFAVNL